MSASTKYTKVPYVMKEGVNESKQYKAVFFDADDTLFDYPLAERVGLSAIRRRFRLQAGEETLVAAYRRINGGLWRAYEQKEVRQEDIPLTRFRMLVADLHIENIDPLELSDSFLDILSQQTQLIEGAQEITAALSQHYPLVLITNGIARVQRPRFERSALLPYFTGIVISEEAGAAKPDPRILWPALSALNMSPLEILLVGDSITSDMALARAAGTDFCWFNPRDLPPPHDYMPQFTIKNLIDIVPLLLARSTLHTM